MQWQGQQEESAKQQAAAEVTKAKAEAEAKRMQEEAAKQQSAAEANRKKEEKRKREEPLDLLRSIHEEVHLQNTLEASGYRSPTWRILRALQVCSKVKVLVGESMITTAPFVGTRFSIGLQMQPGKSSRTTGQLSGSIFPAAFVVRWKNAFPHPFLKELDDHQSHIGGLSKEGESYCGKA